MIDIQQTVKIHEKETFSSLKSGIKRREV